jgi:cytochrome c556
MILGSFPLSSTLVRYTITAISIFALGPANEARADQHETGSASVKYRQSLMSGIGSNMGAIGDIMKNRLDLPGHIEVHAGEMADSAKLIAAAFKKNVSSDATDAKAKIWKDWEKFENAIADLEKAARNLEAAASGSDSAAVGPAMKALGDACGGCHKPFRRPKEESYKRKSLNHE